MQYVKLILAVLDLFTKAFKAVKSAMLAAKIKARDKAVKVIASKKVKRDEKLKALKKLQK